VTPKEFRRYVDRDGGCWHCGETESVAPHHRKNRGMGGSKKRDNPANIILVCSILNGLMESDSKWASTARQWGFKLDSWQDPLKVPVLRVTSGEWFRLTDSYGLEEAEPGGW
jgi:hypothetical protein